MLKGISSIIGKWNENKFTILNKIGEGGMAEVYKVKDSSGNIKAIKISLDVSSITKEFNIIKELSVLDGVPMVYEIDDYYHEKRGTTFYFFVMELIEGKNLKETMRSRKLKVKEIIGIGTILLKTLSKIRDKGYTYTDIKLENILIDSINNRVVIIDFGGIINNEWGIREYTPTYNLISWGIKDSYNTVESTIFGVTMIMISLLFRRESNPLLYRISDIIKQIKRLDVDYEIKNILLKGVKVKYKNMDIFINELNTLMISINTNKKGMSRRIDMINLFFIISICIFLFVIIYGLNILNN